MKVFIGINHPAHVHLFKNLIGILNQNGHKVIIGARNKDVTVDLLNAYNYDFSLISTLNENGRSLLNEAANRVNNTQKLFRDTKPDLAISMMEPTIPFASKITGVPHISLTDTEHAKTANHLTLPFTDIILTPSCYNGSLGKKQIRYNGYHELAYLHPNYFTPNPAVLTELGLTEGDPFIIVRFVSWQASHDVGQHGIHDKVGLVKALEEYGRVLITSEGALPPELQAYQIRVSPEKLHDLLYYATLYVGEGATTASECAVLGTHAIYVNSLGLGYVAEEDEKYHLVSDFSGRDCTDETVLAEAKRLLQNPDLRGEGKQKSEALVQDKIDVTAFMVWFVEHYPESVNLMKNDPEIQQQFGHH